MPKKMKVNATKLIEAVESGQNSNALMKEFGIKTLSQLKSLYVDALAQKNVIPPVISSRGKGGETVEVGKELHLNKRGSLIVPRELIDDMGFQVGDIFEVRKTAAGVSLKKTSR